MPRNEKCQSLFASLAKTIMELFTGKYNDSSNGDPGKFFKAQATDIIETNSKPHIVYSVDIPKIEYFRHTVYDRIDPVSGSFESTGSANKLEADHRTNDATATVQASGKGWNPLYIPTGFEPLRVSSGELAVDNFENYYFRASRSTVTVDLIKTDPMNLTEEGRRLYTTTNRISRSEWPKWLKTEIEKAKETIQGNGHFDELKIAEQISSAIRSNMKYPLKKNSTTGAVNIAHSGFCQCSGASLILASVLRSEFAVPVRAVSGRTANKENKTATVSTVDKNSQFHMWCEVFDHRTGKWHTIDPTPSKRDKSDEKEFDDDASNRKDTGDEREEDKQDPNDSEAEPNKKDNSKNSTFTDDAKQKAKKETDTNPKLNKAKDNNVQNKKTNTQNPESSKETTQDQNSDIKLGKQDSSSSTKTGQTTSSHKNLEENIPNDNNGKTLDKQSEPTREGTKQSTQNLTIERKVNQKNTSENFSGSEDHKTDVTETKEKSSELANSKHTSQEAEKLKQALQLVNDPMPNQTILKHNMDIIWEKTLRQYDSYEKLDSALEAFRALCEKLYASNPEHLFYRQLSNKAIDLKEKLDLTGQKYASLTELAFSLKDMNPNTLVPKLRFLKMLYGELRMFSPLTPAEENVLHKTNTLIGSLGINNKSVSNRSLGETFVAQLSGPISRKILENMFPPRTTSEEFNWDSMAEAIKAGKLNDFAIYGRLVSYLNLHKLTSNKPAYNLSRSNSYVPINEQDPDIGLANDLDRMPFFYRDGAPINLDMIRLISGDMLENKFPEVKVINTPKRPNPHEVSIVLYDTSSSMKNKGDKFRDALLLSYIDHSQKNNIPGKQSHTIYTIGFTSEAESPVRISSFPEALKYFERLREYPIEGSGSTNVTKAVISAYKALENLQKTGAEFGRANIVLITDGDESVDQGLVNVAINNAGIKVQTFLNVISLKQNDSLKAFASSRPKNSTKNDSYQLLDTSQLENIMDVTSRMKEIEESAKSIQIHSNKKSNEFVNHLKESINRLSSKRVLNTKAEELTLRAFIDALTNAPQKMEIPMIKTAITFFFEAMETPISSGWTSSEKAQTLQRYLESIANQSGVSQDHFLEFMGDVARKKALAWIKNNN